MFTTLLVVFGIWGLGVECRQVRFAWDSSYLHLLTS